MESYFSLHSQYNWLLSFMASDSGINSSQFLFFPSLPPHPYFGLLGFFNFSCRLVACSGQKRMHFVCFIYIWEINLKDCAKFYSRPNCWKKKQKQKTNNPKEKELIDKTTVGCLWDGWWVEVEEGIGRINGDGKKSNNNPIG